MAKKKGESNKSGKVPVCECQHPFNCDCGLRPERPSRGHKWDPEAKVWGGKGHKQKGGIGGAIVGTGVTVTEKGKTTVAQWMKLPHQLLDEFCKKEKRPPAQFTSLNNQSGKFKFRVIIQDAKASKRGGEYDLIFIPKAAVENEEQAKEEAAMLALLSLTPNLPHERKLPEPYKTTWLNALAASKEFKNVEAPAAKERERILNDIPRNTVVASAATASSSLVNVRSYSSISDKRKQDEEKRKEKLARIRKHEALRMANRDMQVFMSAKMRKQIESLLRGDTEEALLSALVTDDEIIPDNDQGGIGEDDYDTVKSYIIERLSHEGFTIKQAIAGYTAVMMKSTLSQKNEDEYMDRLYDECLQWLCVHLDEDNLPEGFDPRGGSLEIISTKKRISQDSKDDPIIEEKKSNLTNKFGVSFGEASLILKAKTPPKIELFRAILRFHNVDPGIFSSSIILTEDEKELNSQTSLEEEEVLRAMFPLENDFQVKVLSDGVKLLTISLSTSFNLKQSLVIEYQIGVYPSVYPKVFIIGGWNSVNTPGSGTAVHLKMYKFLLSLQLGEPMVFEIYNYAQEVLQTINDDPSVSLSVLQFLEGGQNVSNTAFTNRRLLDSVQTKVEAPVILALNADTMAQQAKHTRGRGRGAFWNIPPNKAPPANPNPKVSSSIERGRTSLPAATSKNEFLRVLKEAEGLNNVVLVTGETGCGKVC